MVSASTILSPLPLPLPLSRTSTFHTTSPSNKLSFISQSERKLGLNFRNSSSSSSIRRLTISCGVTEINESQFSDVVLKSDPPVLVEFVATWCGPCRLISPAIDWLSQEYKEKLVVVKIDHDANPKLIEEYKVYGLPTLILFKNGKEIPGSRREGAITKIKLKEYVDSLLDSLPVS